MNRIEMITNMPKRLAYLVFVDQLSKFHLLTQVYGVFN
jgi:hypothetical protein